MRDQRSLDYSAAIPAVESYVYIGTLAHGKRIKQAWKGSREERGNKGSGIVKKGCIKSVVVLVRRSANYVTVVGSTHIYRITSQSVISVDLLQTPLRWYLQDHVCICVSSCLIRIRQSFFLADWPDFRVYPSCKQKVDTFSLNNISSKYQPRSIPCIIQKGDSVRSVRMAENIPFWTGKSIYLTYLLQQGQGSPVSNPLAPMLEENPVPPFSFTYLQHVFPQCICEYNVFFLSVPWIVMDKVISPVPTFRPTCKSV